MQSIHLFLSLSFTKISQSGARDDFMFVEGLKRVVLVVHMVQQEASDIHHVNDTA